MRERLEKEAKILGLNVDGRWSDETLREKIEEAKTDPTPNAHPLDHDGNGQPGGAVTAEQVVEHQKRVEAHQSLVSAPREKTLHELNMEQRAIDAVLREQNMAAGEAARAAVVDVLNEKRPDGKRNRKNLRPVAQ